MWVRVAELEVLRRNGGLKRVAHPLDAMFEVLVLLDGERLSAIRNECPHQGAPFTAGFRRDEWIECPLHSWRFRITTGAGVTQPWESIGIYPTRVVDGLVEVELPD
jgi:anthranilate 1,2-dioxygenase ferredoxin component